MAKCTKFIEIMSMEDDRIAREAAGWLLDRD